VEFSPSGLSGLADKSGWNGRLEARQAPRWSDAEAANPELLRLMAVRKGFWMTGARLKP
jgi:hypothetical protein